MTASLKVTPIGASAATPVLPLTGTVWATLGATSPPVNPWPVLHAPNVFAIGAVHAKSV